MEHQNLTQGIALFFIVFPIFLSHFKGKVHPVIKILSPSCHSQTRTQTMSFLDTIEFHCVDESSFLKNIFFCVPLNKESQVWKQHEAE